MKFKGDIIITDPCYLMRKSKIKYPSLKDFGIPDYYKNKDHNEEEKIAYEKYSEAHKLWSEDNKKYNDWEKCQYGDRIDKLGIKHCLISSTEYGDWSCTTVLDNELGKELIKDKKDLYLEFFNKYNFTGATKEEKDVLSEEFNKKSKEIDDKISLGSFCADAGLVGVFLLDEVLAYNPDFDYHINRLWTTTLIKDFDGDIEITHRESNYVDEDGLEKTSEPEVSVVGKGNINFYTTQTGF